jgi:hypothetical protein
MTSLRLKLPGGIINEKFSSDACSFLRCASARARSLCRAPPPNGNGDNTNNNCQQQASPCATGQHAVDQIPLNAGVAYYIYFASNCQPGPCAYSGAISIPFWKVVNLIGSCADLTAVSLRPSADNQTIVYAQDGAIVGVNCLELNGGGFANVGGLGGRQCSILDFSWVYFTNVAIGISVATSTASCVGPVYVYGGSMRVFAAAGNNSFLHMPCLMTLLNGPAISYFAEVGYRSTISFAGGRISGGVAGGSQYGVIDGTLDAGGNALPGNCPCNVAGSGMVWGLPQ